MTARTANAAGISGGVQEVPTPTKEAASSVESYPGNRGPFNLALSLSLYAVRATHVPTNTYHDMFPTGSPDTAHYHLDRLRAAAVPGYRYRVVHCGCIECSRERAS